VLTIASYAEESNHEKLAWIDIAVVRNNDIIVAGLVHRAVARFLAYAVKATRLDLISPTAIGRQLTAFLKNFQST
jgi:hypothetical protein